MLKGKTKKDYNFENNFFCLKPFLSITVEGNGAIRLCCATKYYLGDASKGDTLTSVLRGSKLNKIRSQIKCNTKIEECIFCTENEFKKNSSLRLRYFDFWEKRIDKSRDYLKQIVDMDNFLKNKLKDISLSFSNKCNLNCVMCSSEYSSKWFKYDRLFIDEGLNFRQFTKKYIKKTILSDNFLDDLLKHVNDLERLEIKGGEALVEEKCIDFLEKLSKINRNVKIFITTNGTYISSKAKEVLSKFKSINILISIDGTFDVYEWIRGFKFSEIEKNINILSKVKSIKGIDIAFTSSVYNFWNICDFIEWTKNIKTKNRSIKNIYFFQHAKEAYISVRNIPIKTRKKEIAKIERKIKEVDLSYFGFESLLVYLHESDNEEFDKKNFLVWTEKCNIIREKNIYDIVPILRDVRATIKKR